MTPAWLYDLFGAFMILVAGYSAVLLAVMARTNRRQGWDVDVAHALMGVSMAGMFIPSWSFGSKSLWEPIFAALLIWFVARSVQSIRQFGIHLPHFLVHGALSLGMILMYAFPGSPSSGSMGSMSMAMTRSSGARLDPAIALLLVLCFLASATSTIGSSKKGASHHGSHALAYAGANGGGAPRNGAGRPTVETLVTTPWVEDASHVAMCAAMSFLLVLMV